MVVAGAVDMVDMGAVDATAGDTRQQFHNENLPYKERPAASFDGAGIRM